MKKTLLTLGLAFSALALTASTKAATASANNVYLGFEDINAGYDVIFDLGAQSSIGTFTTMSVGTDLAAVFGNNWKTDQNLYWGVFGITTSGSGPSANGLITASRAVGQNAWPTTSGTAAATVKNSYFAPVLSQMSTDSVNNTAFSLTTAFCYMATSEANSWTTKGNPSLQPFAAYNNTMEASVTGGDQLNLWNTTKNSSASVFGTTFETGLTQTANRVAGFGVDGTANFSGAVKGDALNGFTAGFSKGGTGTVVFNAANTYSGPTTLSNGTIAFTTLPALNGDGSTNALGSAFGVNPQITLGGSNNTTTLAFKGGPCGSFLS